MQAVLGLLYPHTCPFCGKVTAKRVCRSCRNKVQGVPEPRCRKCSKPIREETAEYCYDCARTRHDYEEGRALWLHRGVVKNSIYLFKYHNRRIHSRFYAEELAARYQAAVREWKVETIIPIPLSRERYRERGYNQAALLAEDLSRILGIPVDQEHLVRRRDTAPQKRLSPYARRTNVRTAFHWAGSRAPAGTVLLVDDIYTTGNTIDSAARTLKKAGAEKVFFLTISIGQGY